MWVGCGLVLMTLLSAAAAFSMSASLPDKQAVIQAALLRQGAATLTDAKKEQVALANSLVAIEVSDDGMSTTVSVKTTEQPKYKAFELRKSNKLVCDIENAVNLLHSGEVTHASSAIIRRIRTSQFSIDPGLVSRTVIELNEWTPYTISENGNEVRVVFSIGAIDVPRSIETVADNVVSGISEAPTTGDFAFEELDLHLASMHSDDALPIASAVANSNESQPEEGMSVAESSASPDALIIRQEKPAPTVPLRTIAPEFDSRVAALAKELELVQAASIDISTPEFVPVSAALDPQAPGVEIEAEVVEPLRVAQAEEPAAHPEMQSDTATPAPSGAAAVDRIKRLVGGEQPTAESQETVAPPEESAPEQAPVEKPKAAAGKGDVADATEADSATVGGDPLEQLVSIDFYQMDLSNVVTLLAKKAQVNVIGGDAIQGQVTAQIKNIPLRHALELVLELHGLGIVEEDGVLKIVTQEEAQRADRTQEIIFLENSNAEEVKTTLDGVILGDAGSKLITVTANPSTNIVIVAGPRSQTMELAALAKQLDVAEPSLPTSTEVIRLNYAETETVLPLVKNMISKDIGRAEAEDASRSIIVTDLPVVIEQIRTIVKDLDLPTKQVQIRAMVVDAVLRDASQIGSEWLMSIVKETNRYGQPIGSLQNMSMAGDLGAESIGLETFNAGAFSFGTLTNNLNIQAKIAAEVGARNAEILANPVVVTVENKQAEIEIVQDFPYQKLDQATTGPPVATTAFKEIGITLMVKPRVTSDNSIITDIEAKQSSVSGLSGGVPIEDRRQAKTSLRTKSGQTAFIGGLRNVSDRIEVSKIPILGDIPVLNFFFKNNNAEKINTELMIFITCDVLEPYVPPLTVEQQTKYDKLGNAPEVPDGQRAGMHDYVRPQDMRDPFWKWRRTK